MNQQSDNKVEVVVTAIDGECLVLETVPHKNRICWPLKNIPSPLDIGSRLTLELQQNCADIPTAAAPVNGLKRPVHKNEQDDKEEHKRLLLEQLVN
jgi:hypothetical protein